MKYSRTAKRLGARASWEKEMNRTTTHKKDTIQQEWHVVDATGIPVGRLAGQVAQVIRGKHKPTFQYNADCGDFVIVVNAEKAIWTGKKNDELVYWHTMYPGGIKNISRGKMMEDTPEYAIEKAVWGMTPKTKPHCCRAKGRPMIPAPTIELMKL